MKSVYSLVWAIDVNKGGMTSVMLNRSKMLQDEGYNAHIITLDYNPMYNSIREALIKIKKLDPRVKIINVNDYYREKNTRNGINYTQYEEQNKLKEKGFLVQDDEYAKKKIARYFNDSDYVKYKKWNENGDISHIDYFNANKHRTYREEFHPADKYIHRVTFFDLATNTRNTEKYFTPDGFCYLVRWYNSSNDKLTKIFLFDKDAETVKLFDGNLQYHTFWLNELSKNESEKPFIICDGPGSAQKMIESDSDLNYKISVVHINHFEEPYTYGSEIKKDHSFLDTIDKLDKLVVLTEKQKNDIVKQFNQEQNIVVIPNSIPEKPHLNITYSPAKVGMFVRYHKQKDIRSAILAFRIVVNKIPDATLEIFGHGQEEADLRNFIKEQKLEGNVFIKGYSNNVQEDIQKCVCTILTSKYEAFGLSVAESMLYKTPVIAFDCNYGPSDVIRNGIDGFVIYDRDIKLLAKKIIEIIQNPVLRNKFAENGRENILTNFSDKTIVKKWIGLFNEIEQKDKNLH